MPIRTPDFPYNDNYRQVTELTQECPQLRVESISRRMVNVADPERRILVADDEELIREVIGKKIRRHLGYSVIEAVDGLDALRKIEKETPDLLITDIRMPNMDGMALLEKLSVEGLSLPVVILTGYGQMEDALRAIRLGAKGFMKKPFDPDEVVRLIEGIFAMPDEREDVGAVMPFIRNHSVTLKIPNNYEYLQKVANFVFSTVRESWQLGKEQLNDLKVSCYEALLNAFEHGNLRIDKKEKERLLLAGHDQYRSYLLSQTQKGEGKSRSIICSVTLDPVRVEVLIQDEGEGFAHSRVWIDYEELDEDSFLKAYGRGLFLIKSLMDEVSFSEKGNMIRLVKYRPRQVIGDESGHVS